MDHEHASEAIGGYTGRNHLQLVLLHHTEDGGEEPRFPGSADADVCVLSGHAQNHIGRRPGLEGLREPGDRHSRRRVHRRRPELAMISQERFPVVV